MKENLIPSPPKFLIVFFGIISFFSLLLLLLGKYGFSSVESSTNLYKVNCSFKEQEKNKGEKLLQELKEKHLEAEIVSKVSYKIEDKGYIVTITYEGNDRQLLADRTKNLLTDSGFAAKIFTPDSNPNLTKVRIGSVYQNYSEARTLAERLLKEASIQKAVVETNKVVVGKETIYTVVLKTRVRANAEDYNLMLSKKGYTPEMTTEKL
jgi:hypothetical protein